MSTDDLMEIQPTARPVRGDHHPGRHRRAARRSSPPTAPTAPSATPIPWRNSRPWSRPPPRACSSPGRAAIELAGDTATGTQPLCFVDHATHEMRIGYYNDTYVRTAGGWRLRTRAMTFIRRNGAHDSGPPARLPARANGDSAAMNVSGRRRVPGGPAGLAGRATTCPPGPTDSLDGQVAQLARVRRALYDAGWMRYGWPAEVGGLGGPGRAAGGARRGGRQRATWPSPASTRWSRSSPRR